jgi:hypothetical protein
MWLQETQEAFMIILAFLELMYLVDTHASNNTSEGCANASSNRAMMNPKNGAPSV